MSDDLKLRHQMYCQIFYVLDHNFDNSLDIEEISAFGEYALGTDWDKALALDFLDKFDTDQSQSLGINEFALFCDEAIYRGKTLAFIQQRAKGFLEVCDRKESMRQDMWHDRAHEVDVVSRWTIPLGFLIFVISLYNLGDDNLRDLATTQQKWQVLFYTAGMTPLVCALISSCFLGCFKMKKANKKMAEDKLRHAEEAKLLKSHKSRFEDVTLTQSGRRCSHSGEEDGVAEAASNEQSRQEATKEPADLEAQKLSPLPLRAVSSAAAPNSGGQNPSLRSLLSFEACTTGGDDDTVFHSAAGGAAAEVLRAELQQMKMSTLRKRAVAAGVDAEKLEGAEDDEDPRSALIWLVVESKGSPNLSRKMTTTRPA